MEWTEGERSWVGWCGVGRWCGMKRKRRDRRLTGGGGGGGDGGGGENRGWSVRVEVAVLGCPS